MMIGVVIVLIFAGLLGIMIKLYEDHVDYLNREIRALRMKIDDLDETVQIYGGIIDDEQHYYEKWRETEAELDEANQQIWDLKEEIEHLDNQIQFLQEYESEYR